MVRMDDPWKRLMNRTMGDEWRRQAEQAAEQGVDSALKVAKRGRETVRGAQKAMEVSAQPKGKGRGTRSRLTVQGDGPKDVSHAVANGAATYERLFFSKAKGETNGIRGRRKRSVWNGVVGADRPPNAEGIYWSMENKEISVAVGGTALLVGIPATRTMLVNLLVRRFRSEESLFRSAERRAGRLNEWLELQEKEYKKLEERAVLAAEEMQRGMGKLTAAGSQLKNLGSEARKMESKYVDLLQELRRIPGSQSVALRGQVAESASSVKKQRQAIERHVNQIVRQGIDI